MRKSLSPLEVYDMETGKNVTELALELEAVTRQLNDYRRYYEKATARADRNFAALIDIPLTRVEKLTLKVYEGEEKRGIVHEQNYISCMQLLQARAYHQANAETATS